MTTWHPETPPIVRAIVRTNADACSIILRSDSVITGTAEATASPSARSLRGASRKP
jgi:hypothetical protein